LLLGLRELHIEVPGLGSYNGKARFPNQEGHINVHKGGLMVTRTQGKRAKGQRETAEACKVADIQTPSIGDFPFWLPCLKVIGGRRVGCAARIDSWRPRLVTKEEISAFQISQFMLAIRIMLSPTACQVEMARPRLCKKAILGSQGSSWLRR